MKGRSIRRLPEEQEREMRRAERLEWAWMVALGSIVAAIYLTVGNSQAMKTAWIEDLLSFVPPVAFLAASWIERRKPNARFPIGYVRVTSIAYLVSSVTIAVVALFLIYDGVSALVRQEHPTIGSVEIYGYTFWFGWLMIAALTYSVILPVVFGRLKMRPAQRLHDKVLWADAVMNKADWLTGLAAAIGVLGIGIGWWWADAVAALLIAADVLHDGVRHTLGAVCDLMDEVPHTVDDREVDPLRSQVEEFAAALPWVGEFKMHLREEGRFFSGTLYVKPRIDAVAPEMVRDAEERLRKLHWRVHHLPIVPLPDLTHIQGN